VTTEEVGDSAFYLSDLSRVTGEILHVDSLSHWPHENPTTDMSVASNGE
jgi:enoyl-[acyl-carrier-protein] reductase (NADH)